MSSMCSSWRRYSCSIACQTSLSDVSSVSLREYMAAATPEETQYYPTEEATTRLRRKDCLAAMAAIWIAFGRRDIALRFQLGMAEARLAALVFLSDRINKIIKVVLRDLEPQVLILAELIPRSVDLLPLGVF